jgi:hypothetical protein
MSRRGSQSVRVFQKFLNERLAKYDEIRYITMKNSTSPWPCGVYSLAQQPGSYAFGVCERKG